MGKPHNQLAGQSFGYLTAIRSTGSDKFGNAIWECLCCCGNLHSVTGTLLKRGHSKSCGCKKNEFLKESHTIHGFARTKEYRIWAGIKTRCTNPNATGYDRYGGRGILMCKEWMDDFNPFYEHIGPMPTSKHTVERIDNSKGYEPGNVRWATRIEQNNNMRSNRQLTLNGRTQNIGQWAKEIGICQTTLAGRIDKHGWSIEKALSTGKLLSRSSPHSRT